MTKVDEIVELMLEDIDGYVVDLLEDKDIDVSSCESKIVEYIKAIRPELVKSALKMIKEEPSEELKNLDNSYVREYLPLGKMKNLFNKMFI
jgi:hypothetical protein